MNTAAIPPSRPCRGTIEYRSGGETFAKESFPLKVQEGTDLYAMLRAHAEASSYSNERIPDLDFAITVAAP